MIKLCVNCKYYSTTYFINAERCTRLMNVVDLVTGNLSGASLSCRLERDGAFELERCGKEGKFYEPIMYKI